MKRDHLIKDVSNETALKCQIEERLAMKKNTSSLFKSAKGIQQIYENVAGIDIGSKEIYVAIPTPEGEVEVHTFGTSTPELYRLTQKLQSKNIQSAAMEATGIYWVPLYEILEDAELKPCLVDAKSVKNVPGRKTDVLDCQWIQKTYACGLLRPAFRPPKEREAFRAYMRHRDNLVKGRQTTLLRMQKSLLLMNLKIDLAVSDIASMTAMAIIRAIIGGERDPEKLTSLRDARCQQPPATFVAALTGNYQEPHLFSLRQALENYDFLGKQIEECDKMIERELQSWKTVLKEAIPEKNHAQDKKVKKTKKNQFNFDIKALLHEKNGIDLTAIPGISETTAALIISELGGTDISAFKSEKQWASWLGLCPGNRVSGGKSHGGKSRKCNNRIKQGLCIAAMAVHNSKSAIGAFFRRMKARLGVAKATKAVAHKLGRWVYQMLKNGTVYIEQGQEKYEKKWEERRLKNLTQTAKALGYDLVKKAI